MEACFTGKCGNAPFLYAAYLLIEYLQKQHSTKIKNALGRTGAWGFLPGAVLGCIPQCGFSAMAANFYSSGVVSAGTMMAVFLATSDEAVPILFAVPHRWPELVLLLILKIVIACIAGFVLDVAVKRFWPGSLQPHAAAEAAIQPGHSCCHKQKNSLLLAALGHTAGIFFYILLFSTAVGFIMELTEPELFYGFLRNLGVLQPAAAAWIGLIPNCAASVLLMQLYLNGAISFGALTAGLCSGAGVGLAVLYQTNKNWRQNLLLTVLLWFFGTVAGTLLLLLKL